jgi:hypothetical protein
VALSRGSGFYCALQVFLQEFQGTCTITVQHYTFKAKQFLVEIEKTIDFLIVTPPSVN